LPSEEVRLEETARQIISVFSHHAKEKGISIEFEKTGEIPKMRLNLAGLKICLSSLIDNAIKYSPKKSRIKVSLLCHGERTVRLEVRDNGPGIPEKETGQVFNKFYRGESAKNKTKGSGLGLYITKTLVKAMGGSIRVESTNGAGSCFQMEFKYSPEIQDNNLH
jgi:signal transduction histidine kinase